MVRYFTVITLAIASIAMCGQQAIAQNQIADLFPVKTHEFGVVARGAKSDYSFKFKNTLSTPISFSGASVSCGCVTPIIKTHVVNPGEVGEIVAQFNTMSFVGNRRSTILLNVQRPYFTQVQLHISGYVRTDVVMTPQAAEFTNVVAGQALERNINLQYAGSPAWKIVEVRSANSNIRGEATETSRVGGRIGYNLKVSIDPAMGWGYLNEQLVIVTNDSTKRELPVMVVGNLNAPLEFPATLNLGTVPLGTQVTRTLMVKSANAFTVTGVQSENPKIQFSNLSEKKKLQILKLQVDTSQLGLIDEIVTIQTDVPNMPSAEVRLTGSVIK